MKEATLIINLALCAWFTYPKSYPWAVLAGGLFILDLFMGMAK